MRFLQRGISGSTLKIIAIVTMLIDHTGAIILERMLNAGIGGSNLSESSIIRLRQLYFTDVVMRQIGRIAFPLFCFLLIEGFCHTNNIKKYFVRMLLFAAASEIPFDLGLSGRVVDFGYQNVFFTLLIGLLYMVLSHHIESKLEWNQILKAFSRLVILGAGMLAAELLHVDYGAFGILTVAAMYEFKARKVLAAAAGCAVLAVMGMNEAMAFLSLIPVWLYNGKRGLSLKYLFYVFYPLHILILYLIALAMGLGGIFK